MPAGTYYFARDNRSSFFEFGGAEPRGISIRGDGPKKSTLAVSRHTDDDAYPIQTGFYYADGVDHGTVEIADVRLDGNYENLSNLRAKGGGSRCINMKGAGDAHLTRVHVRGWYQEAILGRDMLRSVDYCTFEETAIADHNYSNGGHIGHHISTHASKGNPLEVTNSLFVDCSGSAIDVRYNEGEIRMHDCYVSGTGANLCKLSASSRFDVRRVYHRANTPSLESKLDAIDGENFYGRCFVQRISDRADATPTLYLQNVETRDHMGYAIQAGAGQLVLEGDMVAIHNSTFSIPDEVLRDHSDSYFTNVSVDRLSIHDCKENLFGTQHSDGTIATLTRDNNQSGLGSPGNITIKSDNPGGTPFQPATPAASEVGIAANTDGSPSVSWQSPTNSVTEGDVVHLQVEASDSEDSDDSLTVEYRTDGGSWSTMAYDSNTGTYEADWDTATISDGTHTLEARATDSAGNSASAKIEIAVRGPVFNDWTPRWESSHDDWSIISGSEFTGGYALAFEHSGGNRTRYGASYDTVGKPADVELLDKFRVPVFNSDSDLGFHARAYLRASVSGGNENGYWIEVENRRNAFRLGKYTNGSTATLKRFGTPVEDTFYYRRFRVEGDTVKAKIWQADQSEPADWDVTLTDTDHSNGWVGLGSYDAGRVETDVFSVATGGASAQFAGGDETTKQDESPSISWQFPSSGSTLGGTVSLRATASDSEDSDDSLTVEYRTDGGSWSTMAYDSNTGTYEADWDTATISDGTHTLEARATDSAGNSASAKIDATVKNAPVVEEFSVTQTKNQDWNEYEIDWSVADSSADLDMVVSTLRHNGAVVSAQSTRISGDSASYLHALRDRGTADEIRLTVNDTENRTHTESKTL